MGLAVKHVFLLTASLVLLLLSFEVLEGVSRVSHGGGEVSAVAVTRDADSGFLSRFRMMLVSLDHHRPRHPHRSHQKSSAAPAPAPAVQVHDALPTPIPTPAAPTPAPLPHESHRRMPLRNHSRIAPARSVARKLGGGGHARLPTAAIVALAVAGACLLVLGVAMAAAASLRRSRKLQKKPFKLFLHGSRAHRSTCATIKVSSHPSPGSAVQCQDYPILTESSKSMSLESSESKSLSVLPTASKSAELIISDYAVKTSTNMQSDEADSFHSLSCSRSSGGSITESPLQICDKPITDPSPSSRHRDDSPSSSSYQSLSPDCRSPFCPKIPPFTAPDHTHVLNAICHLPENPDEEKTGVSHQKTATATNNSGSMGHPEAPKVEQVNAKLSHLSSGYKSTSYATETTPSETNSAFRVSSTNINLDPKESIRNSAEEAKSKPSGTTSIPKTPPPPPPPIKPTSSLKGQNSGQPPLPPPLPIQLQVGKDGLPLPRLKPLHWDKVRAPPNRSMVWNDIQSSSFEFE